MAPEMTPRNRMLTVINVTDTLTHHIKTYVEPCSKSFPKPKSKYHK